MAIKEALDYRLSKYPFFLNFSDFKIVIGCLNGEVEVPWFVKFFS